MFEVKLDCLENKGEVATGDAHCCTSCQAVFSSISKLTLKNEKQIWQCEFCNTENEVNIDDEEIPKTQEVTYLVEAAKIVAEKVEESAEVPKDKPTYGNDASVIFCIDQSSSMN